MFSDDKRLSPNGNAGCRRAYQRSHRPESIAFAQPVFAASSVPASLARHCSSPLSSIEPPPTSAPMLVPAMQSTGTCVSSRTFNTPTWAPPFAPLPSPGGSATTKGRGQYDVGPFFVAVKPRVSMLLSPISDLCVRTHWGSGCPANRGDDDGCNRLSRQSTRLEHDRA